MINVLYVSGSRADYGPVRRVLQSINEHPDIDLKILVTGMHLDPLHGETWQEIERDGFAIAESVPGRIEGDSVTEMAASLGTHLTGMSYAISRLNPDILLAGINGSRLGLYKYDERLINVTKKPRIIIPTHWDSFNLPYSFSQEDNVNSKLIPFKETVARLAPQSTVIIPKHLEPFIVN